MARAKKPARKARTASAVSRVGETLALVRKKFGAMSAMTVADEHAAGQMIEYLSTGVDVLDNYAVGRGGLPIGRMSEIYGPEGCGKTALGMVAIARTQRQGGIGVLIDVEMSFDEERARTFGVDLEELLVLQPQHLEELFEMLKAVIDSNDPSAGPMLIVWDSIAAVKTKAGLEASAGDKTPAEVARLMSEQLPIINSKLSKKRAHLMMLNQVRTKFGVRFGDNTTTPGGNAVKFFATLRLQFFGGKGVKNAQGEHVAKVVTVMAIKNRLSPPFRKGRVRFDYALGYNNVYSTIEHAKRLKKIKPRQGGYKGLGKAGLEAYREALEALGWEDTVDLGAAAEYVERGAALAAGDGGSAGDLEDDDGGEDEDESGGDEDGDDE